MGDRESLDRIGSAATGHGGGRKWGSIIKIAGITILLYTLLLVFLGPLLPAVHTIQYLARGGAYRDKPVSQERVESNPIRNKESSSLELPALPPPFEEANERDVGLVEDRENLTSSVQVVGIENNTISVQNVTAGQGGKNKTKVELPVEEKHKRQQAICLGAPFPLVFGDKGAVRELAFKAYEETKHERGYLRNNKLDPVLVAAEREKKGSGSRRSSRGSRRMRRLQGKEDSLPLRPFCGRRRRPVNGDLQELTDCLMEPEGCTSAKQAKATSQLNRINAIKQYLPKKGSPECITVNRECNFRPRDLTNAKESGKKIGIKAGERIVAKQPDKELNRTVKTCAIVANGPGLYASGVGQAIDAHDVVIKMNLYHLGDRPGKFHDLDKSASLYSGNKSTIRIFNAKRAEDVMKYTMKPAANETWLYWHYRTAIQLDTLIKINPDARFLSPKHLDRMIELYFAFRTLVIQVAKIRRTKCPINLSTGIHSVLTFIHTCERVNLFGFSTRQSDMSGRGRSSEVISSRMSRSHDWNVDVFILNLLAISRRINFCTQ